MTGSRYESDFCLVLCERAVFRSAFLNQTNIPVY